MVELGWFALHRLKVMEKTLMEERSKGPVSGKFVRLIFKFWTRVVSVYVAEEDVRGR
jgi:hypothetical protein